MAGSLESNADIYVKKTFVYVPPSPPSSLIDCSNYSFDFVGRKFLNIGLDPTENFNVMIHIITSSRHVVISPDLLRRIFALMGNILSFILDTPQKYKKTIFLETDSTIISNMVYRSENVLVIESKNQAGCRVILNRSDLINIQYLEWCIFETILQKTDNVKPMVLKLFECMVEIIGKETPQQTDIIQLKQFINTMKNTFIKDQLSTSEQSFVSQIKLFAVQQLAERVISTQTVLEVIYFIFL